MSLDMPGDARIKGLSILEDMSSIYSMMGVCPQHDLLWVRPRSFSPNNSPSICKSLRFTARSAISSTLSAVLLSPY